jgi:PAT family beta-lactamase induction signal transducer AmpG
MTSDAAAPVRTPHTSVFMVLLLPFGISAGYVSVTLAYLLTHNGMTTTALGALVALTVWPQTWKVLWAPIVDTTLTSKIWYVIGAIGVGVPIIAVSMIKTPMAALPLLSALVVISSVASSLTSMASETFMAQLPRNLMGKASGWSQAGNVGGAGLGGGLGLYLAQHVHAQWVSGAALGLVCILCALPLIWMTAAPRTHVRPGVIATLREVVRDVWSVVGSRAGLLVIVLMLLPLGSGGAGNFWAAIAGEWRVNGDTVAMINGVANGVVSVIGSLIGGYLCDKMDRRTAYCLFGALIAVNLIAMTYAPRTPAVFIVSTLLYYAIIGACYAAYSAVVLEAIGKGAAATKFNLMASVSNVPIAVMATADGWFHDKGGSKLMFFGEAGLSVAAAVFFGLLVLATRRWRPKPAPVAV